MKQFLRSLPVGVLLLAAVLFSPQSTFAQLGDPGEDPDAPIDGGVSLLVAAGVGYGVKKYRDSRKEKESNSAL